MTTQTIATLRNPRSVPLTKAEILQLKKLRKKFTSNTDCASSLGLDRVVYDRVMVYGTASFSTVTKIRAKLNLLVGGKNTK